MRQAGLYERVIVFVWFQTDTTCLSRVFPSAPSENILSARTDTNWNSDTKAVRIRSMAKVY
jgi:hypothetical protein